MSTSPLSLRLPTALQEKVEAIAALEHRSLADSLKMLTEEAITMREFPDVIVTSGPTGRRASFRRGPDVWEILEPYVLGHREWSILRDGYPDSDEATLRTAVRYYESYPDEIEARIALNVGWKPSVSAQPRTEEYS